ncbi:hypothetical protein BLL52_4303 [Rhodoferax antarcticus ANT.BR]|uniref:Uncharacterized protein n=1 Tax=Rhodoferax antarcticus ANT.BR TaxID=1111071 RepID=A0A1Q8Y904_9BURK|nr:hypothetical protein BLL52_4303 [Rhodoferax antarcticus ANT.BR]
MTGISFAAVAPFAAGAASAADCRLIDCAGKIRVAIAKKKAPNQIEFEMGLGG